MKIRLEVSTLASRHRSGVASYTNLLSKALLSSDDVDLTVAYFDFLNRQPNPQLDTPSNSTYPNKLFPLRVYAKLQSFNVAPAFDLFLPKAELTIFPNFATWPTIKSQLRATVVHDLTYIYYPETTEQKNLVHLRRVVPRSVKEADFIITVSQAVKAEIVKELGVDPDRCVVTPIPPDEIFFTNASELDIKKVKQKYGINPTKKIIYFIGNLEPRKNLKTLIQAYTLLPNDIKQEFCLVLAGGKGWKTEETEGVLAAAIAKGEDIKHIGFVDQVDSPVLYQAASLFVWPSLYEGFGIPVLEAFSSGVPVVASDIPVLREVGGDFATYADPKSPESFRDAIKSALLRPRPERSELQKVVRKYSWEDNIRAITDKAESLMKKRI